MLLDFLATAMGALYGGLFELGDEKPLLNLFVAIATEEHVMRHGAPPERLFSEPRFIASLLRVRLCAKSPVELPNTAP
jgi:hypothetical protein